MMIYVSHCYGGKIENYEHAKEITRELQTCDTDNTYLCPLMCFSHFEYGELGYETEMDMCIDLLSICDEMIVASELSEGVRREIEFAELVHMPIEYYE